MKSVLSLFALVATIGFAHAGGFGGPPPFTNGSPLPSGVDGSYSGNMTAENTLGVVRWSFSNNIQTSTSSANSYTVFSEGLVFTGPVQVNMAGHDIAGVFQAPTSGAFLTNTRMTGYFTATLWQESPSGHFNGKGFCQFFIADPTAPNTFLNFFGKDFKISGVRNSQATS